MKYLLAFSVVAAVAAFGGTTIAQDKKKGEQAKDDPKLPRVLIVGDSISIGYTPPATKLLAGKANIHHNPGNAADTVTGIKNIKSWLGDGKWDVIHFNWGLHDIKLGTGKHQVSIEDYEKNLREMVKTMKATNAKLIWATTTPVPEGKTNPPRKNVDVIAYNKVAKKIMDENGVAINDIYAFALPQLDKIQQPVNVHFSDKGSAALAERVAAAIEAALKK
jgi:acyl-CoA thioesterase-1